MCLSSLKPTVIYVFIFSKANSFSLGLFLGNWVAWQVFSLFLVRTPREGALDSTAILTISNLARQQADNLNTDFVRFEP